MTVNFLRLLNMWLNPKLKQIKGSLHGIQRITYLSEQGNNSLKDAEKERQKAISSYNSLLSVLSQ